MPPCSHGSRRSDAGRVAIGAGVRSSTVTSSFGHAGERTRGFDFADARRDSGGGLIRYEEVSRAYPVCGACLAALQRGASLGGAAMMRLLLLLGGLALLWILSGSVVHRWAHSFAFYRDGATGR